MLPTENVSVCSSLWNSTSCFSSVMAMETSWECTSTISSLVTILSFFFVGASLLSGELPIPFKSSALTCCHCIQKFLKAAKVLFLLVQEQIPDNRKMDFRQLLKQKTNLRFVLTLLASLFFVFVQTFYLFLCLFFLSLFLRLCVDILCLFFFFPLGIVKKFIN